METVAGALDSVVVQQVGRHTSNEGRDGSFRVGAPAIICADPWDCFRQGYRDFGGNPEWEDRFVDVIESCESEGHSWADTYPLYISRAQFHPESWRRAVGATQLT
ncbi:hypothetical protein LCGC14_2825680, partial [marine sediment metagenome]